MLDVRLSGGGLIAGEEIVKDYLVTGCRGYRRDGRGCGPSIIARADCMKWLVTLVAITCVLKPGADFAPELGVNRHPVKGYVESGGWQAYKKPKRRNLLGASREQAGQTFAPASPKPMLCANSC